MNKKLFAQKAVAIAGIHFARGEEIKGIDDEEQIAICERIGKVGPKRPGKNKPAPEKKSVNPKPEVNEDAELTGEGQSVADVKDDGDANDDDAQGGDATDGDAQQHAEGATGS